MANFGETFDEFRARSGKKSSYYTYLFYNVPVSTVRDHARQQIDILDRISDGYRRKLLKSRYHDLLQHFDREDPETRVNNVTLMGDDFNTFKLAPQWCELLKKYGCREIESRCDDSFDFDWLRDMLVNDNPHHVICVGDRNINYHQITPYKDRKVVETSDRDLKGFVTQHLASNEFVIHGERRLVQGFSHPKCLYVSETRLSPDEIRILSQRIDNDRVIRRLLEDLKYLDRPETSHRLCFKVEISRVISEGRLARLYLTPEVKSKFLEKCKQHDIDLTFEIVVVDPTIEPLCTGENPITKYAGVVGVTYY